MTKRLYYICPIKALYMMKEFGVKFVDEVGYHFEDWRVDRDGINLITDLTRLFTTFPKVYVAKESEGIFKYRENDIVTGIIDSSSKADPIIMRDNKHFFSPEIEE